jgi:hypothetical protein
MKPYLPLLFITLFLSLFICQPVVASRAIVKKTKDLDHGSGKLGTFKALIIGVDQYDDPGIPDLQTAVHDAKAMAKVLKESYGFETSLLLNRQVTRESLYNSLRKLASESKAEDSILIYYAGHGDLDRQYNDGWWIPADARGGNPVSYFDNVQIQKAMRSMAARHVLLISDSCYSGSLFGSSRAVPPVIDEKYYLRLYNEKSRWGMTSGNKEPVDDRGTDGHSVFAYQLLKELRGTEKKFFSTQELYTRIAPIIGNNSEQTPLCRPIRNTGDQGGEFVFVRMAGGDSVSEKGDQQPEARKDVRSLKVNKKIISNTPAKTSSDDSKVSNNKLNLELYDGSVMIPEGKSADYIFSTDPSKKNEKIPLGFTIHCNKVEMEFNDDGTPVNIKSEIVILENNTEVTSQVLKGYEYISYKGVKIYQASYQGYQDFLIKVQNNNTGKKKDFIIPFQKVTEWREEGLRFGVINAETFKEYIQRIKVWFNRNEETASTFWVNSGEEVIVERKVTNYTLSARQFFAAGFGVTL